MMPLFFKEEPYSFASVVQHSEVKASPVLGVSDPDPLGAPQCN